MPMTDNPLGFPAVRPLSDNNCAAWISQNWLMTPFLVWTFCFLPLSCSTSEDRRLVAEVHVPSAWDIVIVMDNSASMFVEQRQVGESIGSMTSVLDEKYGADSYHIGVVTPNFESENCAPCNDFIYRGCVNAGRESGRFQYSLGHNMGTDDLPDHEYTDDPTCRVVTSSNLHCIYDPDTESGTLINGYEGCGYERGLAAIRAALTDDLLATDNAGFLREDAGLAAIVFSDEDDCGEVDDVSENVPGAMGNICYYAAKGVGPEGETFHPDDAEQKTYALTEVGYYHDELNKVKGNRPGMVKFAAIVGVEDLDDPASTTIEYILDNQRWLIEDACNTPGCTGDYCFALPGTRYIQMAGMFGIGSYGFLDTICQSDFEDTMSRLGQFLTACPRDVPLSAAIEDPEGARLFVNGTRIPTYSCSEASPEVECDPDAASPCASGSCIRTWNHTPPAEGAAYGRIEFASHVDLCELAQDGKIAIEVE